MCRSRFCGESNVLFSRYLSSFQLLSKSFLLPKNVFEVCVPKLQIRIEIHEVDEIVSGVAKVDELVINDDQVFHFLVVVVAEQDVVRPEVSVTKREHVIGCSGMTVIKNGEVYCQSVKVRISSPNFFLLTC